MSDTERFARSETPMETPLAGAMFLSGYVDLALEADWVPTELRPRWAARAEKGWKP